MKITGLAAKSVEQLMKGVRARENYDPIPFEEHLLAVPNTIEAIDILIQSFYGNQLLYLLFVFIYGNIDWIKLIGTAKENDTVESFKCQLTDENFLLEQYDKIRNASRTYDSEEFVKLMKNSKLAEIQETIFKLRAEVLEKVNNSGQYR